MRGWHWYDDRTTDQLVFKHVRAAFANGSEACGDLEDFGDGVMGIVLPEPGGRIPLLRLGPGPDGSELAEGVERLTLLWDSTVWRRMADHGDGDPDAAFVDGNVVAVDSVRRDGKGLIASAVARLWVAERGGRGGSMRDRTLPQNTVDAWLKLVDERPTDPGVYVGQDGGIWAIDADKGWWFIKGSPRGGCRPAECREGDIPASAYPMHRASISFADV